MRFERLRPNLVVLLLAIGTSASPAAAQTIRPVISEFETKAQGKFELVNNSDQPLNVVLQPRGFTVDERGEMQDAPLAPGIHLRMSANSLRLPPKQSRWVFYEATADQTPAWFVVYANFSGFPRRNFNGINVQLEMPHIVYVLPKTHWVASDVRIVSVRIDKNAKTLLIDFENQGKAFGRLTDVEVQTNGQKVRFPGFALFPGIRRSLEIQWQPDKGVDAILVKSKEFSFQRNLPLETLDDK